jgi:predicted dehydrogenase
MPVRFAIVGCGHVTERLALPQLVRCRGARVTALVDVDRAAAVRMSRRFGLGRCPRWTDWRRMLREADVDAVAVNLPNSFHAEVALAALRAQTHVMGEKPMALSLREADAMLDAARTHGRRLMVEHGLRFLPVHEAAYRLLRRRDGVGRVHRLRGSIGHAGPEYWAGSRRTWLVDPRRSGGGALFDVGIHIMDLVCWLSGKRVRRVLGLVARLEKRIRVEDNASSLLEFHDGTIGAVDASWTTRPYEVATHFVGRRGQLQTSLGARPHLTVRLARDRGDPNHPHGAGRHPAIPRAGRAGGAYPAFVRAILRGRPTPIPGEEGRHALEVVLGAYESARRGTWVELPLR